MGNKILGDSVAQDAGRHGASLPLHIFNPFEQAALDHPLRIAFLVAHPAPEFRNQQADIVIDAALRADVAGRRNKRLILGNDIGDKGGIQIGDREQRVERSFGERTFTASAGGRRALAGHAGDELHECFGQGQVVNRIENREVSDRTVWRIIATAREDRIDRKWQWIAVAETTDQTGSHFCDIDIARLLQTGSGLQVAWVF